MEMLSNLESKDVKQFLLHCRLGNLKNVQEMLEQKYEHYLNWGLYEACEHGHEQLVHFLIQHGATEWDGGFVRACMNEHWSLAQYLASLPPHNSSFNVIDYGRTWRAICAFTKLKKSFRCPLWFLVNMTDQYESALSIANIHRKSDLIFDMISVCYSMHNYYDHPIYDISSSLNQSRSVNDLPVCYQHSFNNPRQRKIHILFKTFISFTKLSHHLINQLICSCVSYELIKEGRPRIHPTKKTVQRHQ